MNLRCIYCQTPFTLARTEMLSAIVHMNERNMNHYDAHCPRCRRANSISRQRMELFYPNWQAAAKQQPIAPLPPPPTASMPAPTPLRTEPLPKTLKSTLIQKPDARTLAERLAKAPAPKAKKPTVPASSAKGKKKTVVKSKAAKSSGKGKKAPAKGKKK